MQKKINYILFNIAIIISIFFSIYICFVLVPLFLSLDIFGLQDATFEASLRMRYHLELLFFIVFEILFISQMIIVSVINVKTQRQTLKTKSAKKKMRVVSIFFLISNIIYGIVILFIKYLNESESNITYILALLPMILNLIISVYTIFTCRLRTSNNELKDVEENTLRKTIIN